MTDTLHVSVRNERGTSAARRLRRAGQIPAVLYGHGEENVSLAVPASEVDALVRHGSKLVDLAGGVKDKALIRAVQWDSFGTHVLHLDLNRVSLTERVVVSVPVELRGEAPGTKLGGVIEHHVYDVEIECPAGQIPDKLSVNINELELGASVILGDVSVPANVQLLTPLETVVVACSAPAIAEEEEVEEGVETAGSEPEVIGRKEDDSEESSD